MHIPQILITGCAGFIGSHLVERLLSTTDCRIIGIDTASTKIEELLTNDRLLFIQSDVYSCAQLDEYVRGSDVVISLAALCNPSMYNTIPINVIENNFSHPSALVKLCAEHGKRLIHFSTCEVYGRTIASYSGGSSEIPFTEDRSPYLLGPIGAQRWTYACAKQLLERLIYAYGEERDLDYTIVRPFNFVGPRMDYIPGIDGEGVPRVVACFMEALLFGKPLKLVDGGIHRRVFTYIDDAIDAVMAILERPQQASRQVFNIGNPNNEVTIAELARRMAVCYAALAQNHSCRDIKFENVSSEEFYGRGYEDSDRRIPDISKARALLGWEPRIPLDLSLVRTIRAFIKDYSPVETILRSHD
jgi:UDP-apiose/xylose synthase